MATNPNSDRTPGNAARHPDGATCSATSSAPSRRRALRRFGWGAAVVLMLAVAVPALAFGPRGGFGPFGHGERDTSPGAVQRHLHEMAERAFDRIDATEEQRIAVLAILDEVAPKASDVFTRGKDVRARYREALRAEQVDEAALDQLRVDVVSLADDGVALLNDTIVRISRILTPAQRERLHELMDHMRGRRERWRDGGERE